MSGHNIEKEDLVQVKVWDWPLRVLHWTNAFLVIFLALSMVGYEVLEELGAGKAIRRPIKEWHAYIGHVLAVTFMLRVIWGFVGNKYSRWSDIIPYKAEMWRDAFKNLGWVLGGLRGKPPVAIGHNRLASLLYAPIFVILFLQVFSGVVLSGHEFDTMPGRALIAAAEAPVVDNGIAYAHADEEKSESTDVTASGVAVEVEEESAFVEALEEVHEVGFWLIVFFIAAHLAGLILHEVGEKRGLFSSMISGSKYFDKGEV